MFSKTTFGMPVLSHIKRLSGGYSEGEPPVPIPNTVVKPFSADDTSGGDPAGK